MSEKNQECSNCKYYKGSPHTGQEGNVCTRHSPVLIPQLVHSEGFNCMQASRFPSLYAWQSCGEWEAKP